MHVFATLICDRRLDPALSWLDSLRGLVVKTQPPVPVPWPVPWAHRLQSLRHVEYGDGALSLDGAYDDDLVLDLVCSLLPMVDHVILGHFGGRRPSIGHGGILTFPDGETWRASPAQELRLATLFA